MENGGVKKTTITQVSETIEMVKKQTKEKNRKRKGEDEEKMENKKRRREIADGGVDEKAEKKVRKAKKRKEDKEGEGIALAVDENEVKDDNQPETKEERRARRTERKRRKEERRQLKAEKKEKVVGNQVDEAPTPNEADEGDLNTIEDTLRTRPPILDDNATENTRKDDALNQKPKKKRKKDRGDPVD